MTEKSQTKKGKSNKFYSLKLKASSFQKKIKGKSQTGRKLSQCTDLKEPECTVYKEPVQPSKKKTDAATSTRYITLEGPRRKELTGFCLLWYPKHLA
jgi:hypothetical protein